MFCSRGFFWKHLGRLDRHWAGQGVMTRRAGEPLIQTAGERYAGAVYCLEGGRSCDLFWQRGSLFV